MTSPKHRSERIDGPVQPQERQPGLRRAAPAGSGSLQIERGERLCLLGRNGEGKSTLLRLIRGEIEPDEGEVIRQQGCEFPCLPTGCPREREGKVAEHVAVGLDDQGHPPASRTIACRPSFLEWVLTRRHVSRTSPRE